MTERMRDRIQVRMGITVCETYGLSEIIGPGVASECGHSEGMHVWEDPSSGSGGLRDRRTLTGRRGRGACPDSANGGSIPHPQVSYQGPHPANAGAVSVRADLCPHLEDPGPDGRHGGRARGECVPLAGQEHALLGIEGLEPHYQIILSTRPDYQTDLSVRVEMSENVVADPASPSRHSETTP